MKYLTAKNIITINTRIQQRFHTTPSIRDAEALDYIVKSAQQVVFKKVLYDSVEDLATYYLIKIVKKHVFNDANKRTAFLSVAKFLELNDYELQSACQIQMAEQLIVIAKADGESDELHKETKGVVVSSIRKLS